MKIFLYTILLFFFSHSYAQPPLPDTVFYNQSVDNAVSAYKNDVRENLHIYNGMAYLRTGHGIKGTPFFIADSLLPGAVFYDGRLYEHMPLHYDLVSDAVVTLNYQQNNEIQLVPEKLRYFYIDQHLFVRITADSSTPSFVTTGFYEKLYDGKLILLARRQKIAHMQGSAADNDNRYAEYNNYFVWMNDTFYRVDDKKDFLAAMNDKKEAVRKYVKDNTINFNKNREASMIQVADYYSQLKN